MLKKVHAFRLSDKAMEQLKELAEIEDRSQAKILEKLVLKAYIEEKRSGSNEE